MNSPENPVGTGHLLNELDWACSFASLPSGFYTKLTPTPLPNPYLVSVSRKAAELIKLNPSEFASDAFVSVFSGNAVPSGSEPLAAVYSGHQFGVWAGQLGDGRAILLEKHQRRPSRQARWNCSSKVLV